MSGRSIPQPQFPDDDGTAAAEVHQALSAYAEGRAGEYAVLAALAES
ncbi:MAG: hypothetical protein JWR24_2682, partial [Actinoallomurus sp.]|nr:hypothetical protein [Actinoallomurus sp.]